MADWSGMPLGLDRDRGHSLSGFRRRWYYRPRDEPRVVEREDPRVDDLQARVAELENGWISPSDCFPALGAWRSDLSESGRRGS
jgi:hypothetical protein